MAVGPLVELKGDHNVPIGEESNIGARSHPTRADRNLAPQGLPRLIVPLCPDLLISTPDDHGRAVSPTCHRGLVLIASVLADRKLRPNLGTGGIKPPSGDAGPLTILVHPDCQQLTLGIRGNSHLTPLNEVGGIRSSTADQKNTAGGLHCRCLIILQSDHARGTLRIEGIRSLVKDQADLLIPFQHRIVQRRYDQIDLTLACGNDGLFSGNAVGLTELVVGPQGRWTLERKADGQVS